MPGDWDITITDINNTTHDPALVTPGAEVYPRRIPKANGRPRLQFGVPPKRDSSGDPKWFGSEFEGADVSVSLNGTDQPYDTLVGFEDRPSAGVTILEAEGGSELDKPVNKSFGVIPTHEAAEQVIQETSYQADVPTPSTTREDGVALIDSPTEVRDKDVDPIPEDSPAYVANGELSAHQSLFFHDPSTTLSSVGDSLSFSFTLGYSIPAERVGFGFLIDSVSDPVGLEFAVDGTVIGELQPGEEPNGPAWLQSVGSDERLAPGSHTATVSVTAERDAGGTFLNGTTPTGVAVYDDGFDYVFDKDLTDGPALYGDEIPVSLSEPLVTRAVVGASFRGYWQDNVPARTTKLSNGVDDNYDSLVNVFVPNVEFDSRGAKLDATVRLEPYGNDSAKTPEEGFNVTTLVGLKVKADLEDMPLVVEETVEGPVGDVLTGLGDVLRGDFVWTFGTDSQGNEQISFVRTGTRSSSQSEIEGYDIEKRIDRVLDEVTVIGSPTSVSGEGVRVDHANPSELERDRLVEGSETVSDGDGTTYTRGEQYTIDYENGIIQFEPNPNLKPAIPDKSRVQVSYRFEPKATVRADNATAPIRSTTVPELPLKSDGACRLAADELLQAARTPTYVASASIRGNVTFSPVKELASSVLPGGNLETTDIKSTPAGTDIRLEARQAVGDAVDALRDRVESVAQYVR